MLEHYIQKNVNKFELIPLLQAVEQAGYEPSQWFFKRSQQTLSPTSIVEAISFENGIAWFEVNLSLCGPLGELPDLFIVSVDENEELAEVFDVIVHHLIQQYVGVLYPERHLSLAASFCQGQAVLSLVDAPQQSASFICYMVEQCFSDFDLEIALDSCSEAEVNQRNKLGITRMGLDSTLGPYGHFSRQQLTLRFFSESLMASAEVEQIKQRCRQLLIPKLERCAENMRIDVRNVIEDPSLYSCLPMACGERLIQQECQMYSIVI
ncbi:hypothetical protein [Piscirickettsia litoralis]|uniref:EAL domain-containing protein n=1 Tax=Piscirickettsia litoralis TaxID=1891921 RepID=A0ABX3A019_9GAMM|nr:hypothetical protein [Piscirickettsia litoralis]ODN42211.1 hypothetical protein BGC07_03750 [Piscirickettsia litoralis]